MQKTGLNEWEPISFRLTAFLVEAIVPSEMMYWESLVGRPPGNRNNNPQQQLTTEMGPFLEGQLHFEARPNRFDWNLIIDPSMSSPEPPSLGLYKEVESQFQELMLKWLSICQPINRLAFGGDVRLPAENNKKAYQKLSDLLPAVNIDTVNSQDFFYRINRRRDSNNVEGLKINRLSTWTVVSFINTSIDIKLTNSPSINVQSVEPRLFCQLLFDINTAQEFDKELDKKLLPCIFKELVNAGNEIAEKGDIR